MNVTGTSGRSRPPVAVVTVVHGRHEHLQAQIDGLRLQTQWPDVHVVVAMDDPEVAEVVRAHSPAGWPVRVAAIPTVDGHLPLAAARNLGARTAVGPGAEHLVFLDVDCVPAPGLVERYAEVLRSRPSSEGPTVLCGEVAYEGRAGTGLHHHPARPAVPSDHLAVVDDVTLFWSLSFAVTARDFDAVGGFDEAYVGYGGEDTDFGQRLAAANGTVWSVGGAASVHQFHDSQDPPVDHVDDIVRNANLFATRWGWYPMLTWLRQFEDLGLATRTARGQWRPCGERAGSRGGPGVRAPAP